MNTNTETTTALHDPPVPVRAKLAAAWTSFMFFYIYVDYLHLYKAGVIDDILAGVVFEFDISQTFVVIALMIVGIPALMILLSMTLPARANRTLNLVVASLCIPIAVFNVAGEFNVVGESWIYFYSLGVGLEVLILAFILRSAWTWPRTPSPSMPALPHHTNLRSRWGGRRMASIRTFALTKDFGDLRAVNEIDLDLPEGGWWRGSSVRTMPSSPPRSTYCSAGSPSCWTLSVCASVAPTGLP